MRTLILLLVVGLTVTACGRRGALEPPPGAEIAREPVAEDGAPRAAEDAPDRPFILDPLI
ncbi:MAG: LPS translocon maturation chaperone LptM [Alphaproteobacteria bacterium]